MFDIIAFGAGTAAAAFWAKASVAATLAGAAIQAVGARRAAKAEKKRLEYNAAVDRRDAEQRRIASLEDQQIQREKARLHLKRQRAMIAKAGIQMAGSPLEVQLKTAEIFAQDIGMLAYGAEVEAQRFETSAGISKMMAGYAQKAGRIGVGAALLGGAGRIAQTGIEYELNA